MAIRKISFVVWSVSNVQLFLICVFVWYNFENLITYNEEEDGKFLN